MKDSIEIERPPEMREEYKAVKIEKSMPIFLCAIKNSLTFPVDTIHLLYYNLRVDTYKAIRSR